MKILYDFLFIVGLLFLSSYIYILFRSKEKGTSRNILMLFFSFLICVVLESYAGIHNLEILHHISFVPAHSSKLILAPLLLLYIRSLFYKDADLLKNNRAYFIPFFLFVFFVSIPYLIGKISQEYFLEHLVFIQENNQNIRFLLDLVFLFIIGKSFQQFYKLRHVVSCNFSHIEHNNFIWVRYLLVVMFVIISIDLLFVVGQLYFNLFTWRTQNMVIALSVIAIIYMAYYGIKQSKVLVPYFLLDTKTRSSVASPKISTNQQATFVNIEEALKRAMQDNELYLDEELTLYKLATAIGTTDKKLSAVLNQHIKTTFYNYVNEYRLEAFKKCIQLKEYQGYTIEGIAFECGFKSKASFYRLFKKQMGQSPSAYRNSL